MRNLFVLLLLSVPVFGGETKPAAAKPPCCTDMNCHLCQQELQLIREVNLLRARHGLWPLKRDVRLVDGSRWHSYRQARSGSLFHHLDGYATGECIAEGQRNVPSVVDSWYRSSGHRAILLGRNYRFMGASRSGGYWTLRSK